VPPLGQRNFQQTDGTTRLAQTRSDHRRQEHHIALGARILGAVVLHVTFSIDAHQNTWQSIGADCKWRFRAHSQQPKIFTVEKPLAQDGVWLFDHRHNWTDGILRKIDTIEGLFDLQSSGLTGLSVNMVPIVKTKRHVTVFLHFEDGQVTQRMDSSCRNEDSVAACWFELCELIRHGSICE
jgi:hypothetical protein